MYTPSYTHPGRASTGGASGVPWISYTDQMRAFSATSGLNGAAFSAQVESRVPEGARTAEREGGEAKGGPRAGPFAQGRQNREEKQTGSRGGSRMLRSARTWQENQGGLRNGTGGTPEERKRGGQGRRGVGRG